MLSAFVGEVVPRNGCVVRSKCSTDSIQPNHHCIVIGRLSSSSLTGLLFQPDIDLIDQRLQSTLRLAPRNTKAAHCTYVNIHIRSLSTRCQHLFQCKFARRGFDHAPFSLVILCHPSAAPSDQPHEQKYTLSGTYEGREKKSDKHSFTISNKCYENSE